MTEAVTITIIICLTIIFLAVLSAVFGHFFLLKKQERPLEDETSIREELKEISSKLSKALLSGSMR